MVMGLAPILAPLAGAQVLALTSWRGIFVALAVLAALIALLVAFGLGETLPPERRSDHGLGHTLQTMRGLLRDRWFVGHALAGSLGFGALFAYVAGSPFVLQEIYGVSPQLYSVLFAMNGVGLIAASQVNARLVGRFGPQRMLRAGLLGIAAASGTLLVVATIGGLGVRAVLVPMFMSCPACRSCCPTRWRSRSPTTPRSPGRPRRCSARCSSSSAPSSHRWSVPAGPTAPCRWPRP